MAIFADDDPFAAPTRKPPTHHDIGQTLDALSLEELDERIALLEAELGRLREAHRAKQDSKRAADAFFKSGSP